MDATFYEALARLLTEEPVLERDLAMTNMLATIGIHPNEPFQPDAPATAALNDAAAAAKSYLQHLQRRALVPFWPDAHWALLDRSGVATQFSYQTATTFDIDHRGMLGFFAWAHR